MGIIAAATGLFAASTGVPQYFERKKAARKAERKQEEANNISRAQAQVQAARARRRAIAQQRIASAQNEASQTSEVQSSSAATGVNAALGTQLGANIGAQQQRINSQSAIQDLNQAAASAMRRGEERAGMWNAYAQTGQTIISGLNSGGSFGSFGQ